MDILSRMNQWHDRAATKPASKYVGVLAHNDNSLRQRTLDTLSANFDLISARDGASDDADERPGNVRLPGGSLQKTAEGWTMQVISQRHLPFGVFGACFAGAERSDPAVGQRSEETYVVDQANHTLRYTKTLYQEEPFNPFPTRPEPPGIVVEQHQYDLADAAPWTKSRAASAGIDLNALYSQSELEIGGQLLYEADHIRDQNSRG